MWIDCNKLSFPYYRGNLIIFHHLVEDAKPFEELSYKIKLSCMMLNNGELKSCSINCPHVVNWNCLYCGELKPYAINSPRVGNWNSKFCVQYRNVNPWQRRKRDLVKFPICHSWQSQLVTHGELIFHNLWLRHYVVKYPITSSPWLRIGSLISHWINVR